MARARNIKPSLFKNEVLGVEDPCLTLLFISLWCLADKAGRLEDRPLRIKAETFPYRDEITLPLFNAYLTQLERKGFIFRYKVNKIPFIQIINFTKHQSPHSTEKNSEIPGYELKDKEDDFQVTENIDEIIKKEKLPLNNESTSVNGHINVLIPDSLIPDSLIPDSAPQGAIPPVGGKPDLSGKKKKPTYNGEECLSIFGHWQCVMSHPQSQFIAKRKTLIQKRLDEGYTPIQLKQAIDGHKKSKFHMEQGFDDIEYSLKSSNIDKFIKFSGMTDAEITRKSGAINWDDDSWADGLQAELGVRPKTY